MITYRIIENKDIISSFLSSDNIVIGDFLTIIKDTQEKTSFVVRQRFVEISVYKTEIKLICSKVETNE